MTLKFFVLTYNEMNVDDSSSAPKGEGTTYQYCKDYRDAFFRIKHQIKCHDGAVTSSKKITDLDITWAAYNYAGYNSSIDSCGGDLGDSIVYYYAFAVAPAFCI